MSNRHAEADRQWGKCLIVIVLNEANLFQITRSFVGTNSRHAVDLRIQKVFGSTNNVWHALCTLLFFCMIFLCKSWTEQKQINWKLFFSFFSVRSSCKSPKQWRVNLKPGHNDSRPHLWPAAWHKRQGSPKNHQGHIKYTLHIQDLIQRTQRKQFKVIWTITYTKHVLKVIMHLSHHFNHNHLRRTRLLPSNNYRSSALSGYLWCSETLVCHVSFCKDEADNAACVVTSLTRHLPTLHSPAREQEAVCVPSVAHRRGRENTDVRVRINKTSKLSVRWFSLSKAQLSTNMIHRTVNRTDTGEETRNGRMVCEEKKKKKGCGEWPNLSWKLLQMVLRAKCLHALWNVRLC